jgi:uncharacterized membrane-anchored protein
MTLRIEKPIRSGVVLESTGGGTDEGDDWGTRIAKLVPAEALGLYGSAAALVTTPSASVRTNALIVIALIAAGLAVFIRYRSTYDLATRKPQWSAIVISLISFGLWLVALGAPTSPFALPADFAFAGPTAALIWGTLLPYLYRGD